MRTAKAASMSDARACAAVAVLLLLALGPALSHVAGPAQAAPAASANVVTFDPATTFQTITAWEATAQAGQESSPAYANYSSRVIDVALTDLGINRLRVEVRAGIENPDDYWTMWMTGQVDYAFWRSHRYTTVNDDADPRTINWSGFQFSELDSTVDKLVMPMLRRADELGEPLLINVNYVAFTSQNGPGLPYIHDDPDEYAELVLATYIHLDQKYGFTPDYWEVILEPDNVRQWNGGTIGRAMVATQELLAEHGYTVRFIAPSNTNMGGAIGYFDAMATVPGALGNLSELSYHRYGGVSDANLMALADRGAQYGVDTAMLEHIGSGYQDLHKDLTLGNASSWQQFTLASPTPSDGGGAYLLVDARDPASPVVLNASRTRLLRQYFHYVEGGALRVGATSNNATFEPVAFVNPDGRPVVVVKANAAGDLSVEGLPAGTYAVSYATSAQFDVHLPNVTIAEGGTVDAAIPAAGALTVSALNLAPRQVARVPDHDVVMDEGTAVLFEVEVWDDDPAGLGYQWSLDGGSYPALTGPNFTYAPGFADAGVHTLEVHIMDSGEPSLGLSIDWHIVVIDVNRPPLINRTYPGTPLVLGEAEGGNVTFAVEASDPDGDALSYTWYIDGAPVDDESSPSLAFGFDHSSAGTYNVSVRVNDSRAHAEFVWSLTIQDVNRPPVVTSFSPGTEVWLNESEGGLLYVSFEASDPDGDPLSTWWYIDGEGPAGAGETMLVMDAGFNSAGEHSLRAVISDGRANVTLYWVVNIANVNRPPLLIQADPFLDPIVDEVEGGLQGFFVVVVDADEDPLSYAWTVDGVPVPGAQGPTYSFPYDHESAGTYLVAVTATDGEDINSYEWHLTVRDVNRPPVVLSREPVSVEPVGPGVPVNFSVDASDPDDIAALLAYEWYVNGTRVANATGPSWTFAAVAGDSGNRTVRVVVSDTAGATAEATWEVTILGPPPDGDGGDGGGDGDDDTVPGVPARESYLPLLLVTLIILVVALIAVRLAGRDRARP